MPFLCRMCRAAAFVRLCVETLCAFSQERLRCAAAFVRLCVETTLEEQNESDQKAAAFVRLCVETKMVASSKRLLPEQPPSCGCVLKRNYVTFYRTQEAAAAFVRLCVETPMKACTSRMPVAAAFVRLCVETFESLAEAEAFYGSRLRAAVC